MEVRIGTSGWHYRHWRGKFYPENTSSSKMLEAYVQHFGTVEINNSFYRLPSPDAFDGWRRLTPPEFCFAVKASRFITHNKKLKDPRNALDRFLPQVEHLKDKLGPMLFQLPPKWTLNLPRLEEFLCMLPRGRRWRYAFEFRNPTWLTEGVYGALRKHNAAFCIFELAGYQTPLKLTADWTYIRLHGPEGKYEGNYTPYQLKAWAQHLRDWKSSLAAAYVYFDNDEEGFAPQNAMLLKTLIQ